MIRKLSSKSINPHISALKAVFAQATRPIQWLVIAHNDPRLVSSLVSAFDGQSAAVLQVSQDTWDFDSKDFKEMIEWALHQGDIRDVVLVGSSQPNGATSRASLVTARPNAPEKGGYARLLARLRQHNAHMSEVQEEFADHVQKLSQLPVVRGCWSLGQLAVSGLFYRAETGLFLHYDAAANTFVPLGS